MGQWAVLKTELPNFAGGGADETVAAIGNAAAAWGKQQQL
jgi:hypothetical protein